MTDLALRRYFDARYPDRDGPFAALFRAGEAARRAVIAPWLSDASSVLDVGCGDGAFLASVLGSRTDTVHLVDLSPRVLATARDRLGARVPTVHAVAGDCDLVEIPPVDVAIAFGVTDYHPSWPRLIERLRRAARSAVLIDFSRAGTFRNALRRSWLLAHGITLHTATAEAARGVCGDCTLVTTPLHWLARIEA